jgi:hypothetical protein
MSVASETRGPIEADPGAVIDFLRRRLAATLPRPAMEWLDAEFARQRDSGDERKLALALGLVGRKVGRRDLVFGAEDIAAARNLRADWQPERWSADEAARVLMLLAAGGDEQTFAARIDRLCATAEVTELVAYLKGFAVFAAPRALHDRAREGVRSSMRPVFEAIASHNPYPFDHFDQPGWNQMVVKCVFIGTPIDTVVGLRERRNREVVQMLRDLVSERRAAGRPSPDAVLAYIGGD